MIAPGGGFLPIYRISEKQHRIGRNRYRMVRINNGCEMEEHFCVGSRPVPLTGVPPFDGAGEVAAE